MTIVGAGGVVIRELAYLSRFARDFKKLDQQLQARVSEKLDDLLKAPMPPGLRFEKLKGYESIYTIHITGNYKVSMEIDGHLARLRRVANHDEIDRTP